MTTGYVAALDGWRGLSILLVLAAHAGLSDRVPGGLGVTIFFFVSGFLITGQLLDELARHGRLDLARFYWRRALRLLPASTAFIVVAGVAYLALGGAMRPAAWFAALLYLANYAQLATHLFDTSAPGLLHPFVILWSLAIEEQFYLVWPLLIALLARGGGRGPLAAVLAGAIIGCLAWRLHLAPVCGHLHNTACGPHGDDWIAKATDTRADSLAFGAIAAVVLRSSLAPACLTVLRSRAVLVAGAACLLLTVALRADWFRDTWRYTAQGSALLVLVTASMLPANPLGSLLSQPALIAIGRLSYGLYLWHWLALMLARRLAAPEWAPCLFLVLTALFTLASWLAIERPVLGLRRRAGSHATASLVPGFEAKRVQSANALHAG